MLRLKLTMRTEFRKLSGRCTRLVRGGHGYPVLMIHGLGTQAERWFHNVDGLPAGFEALAPDLANHGFSEDLDLGAQAPQLSHVQQMSDLLDGLGVERCAVIGSSYGGLIAALLALQQPQRVQRLVIVGSGSALHSPERQADVLRATKANAMKAMATGTLEGCRIRMAATSYMNRDVSEDMLPLLLTANALPGRMQASDRFFDALIAHAGQPGCQSWPRLEHLSMPTLIVTGRDDIRASLEMAQRAQLRIPHCRLEVFDECGHGPMAEHPVRFNQSVGHFLSTLLEEGPRVSSDHFVSHT